ncbi:hypothetical protein AB0O91_15450 [Kitasatospora sp. NPDC089797]|uniref:hypothetical protein n=1 Tax=Kitasatospora sp. NPDC089797 TaxID=3155298 RepID=UPI00341DCB81
MIDHVLRLYPAAYRHAHGAEIAATFHELTAGEPLRVRLRDGADLAAHGLRLRFGLGPAGTLATVLGPAQPLVLGAAAAAGGLHLLRRYAGLVASPAPVGLQLRLELSGAWGVLLFSALLVFAGAAAALAGRWRAGVPCTVAGLLGYAVGAVVSGPALGSPVATPVAAVLAAAVLVACPPDRRAEGMAGGRAGVAGAMVALVLVPLAAVAAHVLPWVSTDYGCWPLLVLAGTGVALAWRGASGGGSGDGTGGGAGAGSGAGRQLAATALAAPPLLAEACGTAWGDATATACLAAVLMIGAAGVPLAARLGRTLR